MPAADLTKKVIAQGLKKLIQNKSFTSISVADITGQCNISRNTFYYHFKDKYDLVDWIFYTEVTPKISNFSDLKHWYDGLVDFEEYMLENKNFYINVFSVTGQNSLRDYLMEYYEALLKNIIYSSSEDFEIEGLDINIICRFYAHAIIGSIIDWVEGGMIYDPNKHVHAILEAIEGSLFNKVISSIEKE